MSITYRNGRKAKNGDRVVQFFEDSDGRVTVNAGVLFDVRPGGGYWNGAIVPVNGVVSACPSACLHVDDVAAILIAAESRR